MFCTRCGTEITNEAKFCSGCGVAVGGADVIPPTTHTSKTKIETIQDIPKIKISTIFWWIFWIAIIVFFGFPLFGYGLFYVLENT